MRLLTNKVAIITGAGSGIGRATATTFAQSGALVAAVDVSLESARETAKGHESILPLQADVSSPEQVDKMFQTVLEKFGGIDVLVNNAGIWRDGSVEETTVEDWDAILAVNLKGAFLCSRRAVQEMLRHGGGVIVNTASVGAYAPIPNSCAYAASKAGLVGLTRSMARDLATKNIRVNCVCPGAVATPMLWDGASPEQVIIKSGKDHPLGRVASPEEIAQAILFLASDKSSFMTGTSLIIDGGYLSRT
jgi:NAD(P)-dependent dehydrogenase (short-subunit alcohol dehydrogenase family)